MWNKVNVWLSEFDKQNIEWSIFLYEFRSNFLKSNNIEEGEKSREVGEEIKRKN